MSSILDDESLENPSFNEANEPDTTHLWVVSYSDFMTIMMIFFLMLFAHRVWIKQTAWDAIHHERERAAVDQQRGMVQRLARFADVEAKAQRVNIHLPNALLFDAGHADLKSSALELLAGISPDLRQFKGQIVVEGHTDNQPVSARSAYPTNWELSVARAFSVIRFLTEQGVDPKLISARGYGSFRPQVANDTPEHRAENRRTEIVLLSAPNEAL